MAKTFNISTVAISLTVVAFGTSTLKLVVSTPFHHPVRIYNFRGSFIKALLQKKPPRVAEVSC
jgi:hypothetical protein